MDNVYENFRFQEKEQNSKKSICPTRTNVSTLSRCLLCGLLALCVVLANIFFTIKMCSNELKTNMTSPTGTDPVCSNKVKIDVPSVPNCPPDPCPEKWPLFNGSCYYPYSVPKPWDGAKSACEQMNSHLLVINSMEEQKYAVELSLTNVVWIGLTDADGEWKWVDKTPYDSNHTYWREGQPDDWSGHGKGGGEDCAQITKTGTWNDDLCSEKYYFICEKKARQ